MARKPRLDLPVLKSIRNEVRSYIILSIGSLMYSFAWTALLLPAKVVGGGVGGIGTLIFYATSGPDGGGIPMGVTYAIVNVGLLALGFWILGPKFGTKTIYAIVFNSIVLTVLQESLPPGLMGLTDDKLLSAILGGGLAGVGVGLCFSVGGSSGGTDIIAMIINKYRNVSLGKLIMLMDVIIVGSSYLVFRDLASVIYGYVTMFTLGSVVDHVLSGTKSSSQIMVFSCKYEEIAERIIQEVHRGVTILNGVGAYSKKEQKVLLVICRRNEATDIYRIIKATDPQAFITQGSVMGVFGEGFDALKTK